MQRKQQAEQRQQEEANRREEAHWVVSNSACIPPMYPSTFTFLSERLSTGEVRTVVEDEQVVHGVRSGRMSFGDFNPSIEVLLYILLLLSCLQCVQELHKPTS